MGILQGEYQVTDAAFAASDGAMPLRILVVDDSRAQRRLLSVYLQRWGYQVLECDSGEEALALCAEQPIDVVISDWMMPGMSGVEFCQKFRDMKRETYGYFILLTSKSEKSEIARGLGAGADDFLTKPVSADELRARLRGGERILSMQAELVEKNREVARTLEELQRIYDSLDRDLIEARKLQQALVRDRFRDFGTAQVSMMVRTAGHVGGDIVGCFALDSGKLACWAVDVAGHGVAAAMMTARLAGYLSGSVPEHNLAFARSPEGVVSERSPAELAAVFNQLMLEELQVEQYFTMVYAEFDPATGVVRLVQAGHPYPMVIRADGRVEMIGQGGLPVGLVPMATWENVTLQLNPGDRLCLVSDGVTECPNAEGTELGEEGCAAILRKLAGLESLELLEGLLWELSRFAGTGSFPDDVSGLVLDYPKLS